MERPRGSFPSQHQVKANAPYVNRPPDPPTIYVPLVIAETAISIVPSYADVDAASLTKEDLAIIIQNKAHIAHEKQASWKYEWRRLAQPVLDFLYLGPASVARDRDFLKEHGITMLLAARDSSMAEARLMSVDRTAQSLGLEYEYIDVSGHQELIRAFPAATKKINDHLLNVYRRQAVATAGDRDGAAAAAAAAAAPAQLEDGQMAIDNTNFRRGKVLVFCETGNDRSAAIVAAYIMSVFGMDLVRTVQFVTMQRFCAIFDEETKNWLKSYEEILSAKRMVTRDIKQQQQLAAQDSSLSPPPRSSAKRRIEETIEQADTRMEAASGNGSQLDMDRYTDRPAFAPFADGDTPMNM